MRNLATLHTTDIFVFCQRQLSLSASASKAEQGCSVPWLFAPQTPLSAFSYELTAIGKMDKHQLHEAPPATANLLDELDKKLMVVLRDGRTLIGCLRSVDQFANLVLHRTIERIYVGQEYGDIPRGIFLVRGENVVLLGEIDEDKEEKLPLQEVIVENILDAQRREQEIREEKERLLTRALKERGLQYTPDLSYDDMF